ncbi:type IX secretion system membrane protein PorP/SprF [Muricauda sp. CAU 1633]|uniref:PorP/SprF family type IX secretion system membrane protein n=1 Tax=Allomuricauda sp. CAU 1633 TaxID=2816036 RepID=UPI001A8EAD0B|nr:type IX secretion system membrane protein PorP/SprF [Muricauda sp. CAU 1633]MBO0322298.1 type IX secretion system membrane protein PorP/SprF [Muricauda sp. CAU 1633]
MKTVLTTIGVLLLTITSNVFGQQDPHFTFYRYNMNIINPAYVGSSEGAELALGLRSQWAGVEGAPESQSALFGMPMGKNVGLGVSILNDKTFIESQTWVGIDVSYHIQLNDGNLLYFGLKASANSYDANTQGLVTYGVGQDGSLMNYESRFTPNVGAGVYLKNERYFISLSAPKLLSPDRLQEQNGNAFLGTDKIHGYLCGGYDFILSKTTNLQAMGMIRYVEAAPLSYEVTGIVDFGHRFSFGSSYRYDESISGLFMFNVGRGFDLGYAYENALQKPVEGIDNATHELFMRLKM